MMEKIIGVDLYKTDGISESTVVELISEIGTYMSKWNGHKNFSAWLNVVPNTKGTGGKIISSKMKKKEKQRRSGSTDGCKWT
ncbi:MAG: transposase [Salinivirgaceae bacterium]|nr:transposase [Salinivirgaceae bacterium]